MQEERKILLPTPRPIPPLPPYWLVVVRAFSRLNENHARVLISLLVSSFRPSQRFQHFQLSLYVCALDEELRRTQARSKP